MPDDLPAAPDSVKDRFLVEPYNNWAAGEGIPIHVDFGHDLLALETKPHGEWTVVSVNGELDLYTAPRLRDAVLEIFTEKNIRVRSGTARAKRLDGRRRRAPRKAASSQSSCYQ